MRNFVQSNQLKMKTTLKTTRLKTHFRWPSPQMLRSYFLLIFSSFLLLTTSSAPVVRLGRSVSLSGAFAAEGVEVKNGLDFWHEWVNNVQGGILIGGVRHTVDLVTWNDASDINLVDLVYKDMASTDDADKKPIALFGPFSSALNIPAVARASRTNTPIIFSGASDPVLYRSGYNHSFGMLVQASKRSLPCMQTFSSSGVLTMSIVSSNDSFQRAAVRGIISQAAALNITILSNETLLYYQSTKPQLFSTEVEQLVSLMPDVLVLAMHASIAKEFLLQVREKRSFNPKAIYFTSGGTLAAVAIDHDWQTELVFAGDQWSPKMPYVDAYFGSAEGFSAQYQAKFNTTPTFLSAGAFAAGLVMKDALERTVSLSSADIIASLRATTIDTFWGPIRFTQTGEPNITTICQQIQHKQLSIVAPAAVASVNYTYPAYPVRPPTPTLTSHKKIALIVCVTVGGVLLILIAIGVTAYYFHVRYHLIAIPKTNSPEW